VNQFWLAVVIFSSYYLGGLMARHGLEFNSYVIENRYLRQRIANLESQIKEKRND